MNPEFPSLTTRRIYSVSELLGIVTELFEAHFGAIYLEGEITNLRQPASGHLYFSLRDGTSQIKGVVFRRQLRLFDFTPEEGMTVICRGRLNVYEARGDLQMIIDYMEPSGRGAYRMALERLKKKLAAEGLFDASKKRPLPILPRVIGVVTSPTGAAIRDILKVIRKRNKKVTVRIYPARVQGIQASDEIAEGIRFFNRHQFADVLIVGRGGGASEDLDAFNSEKVVRAIAESQIPVISAVGHEIDMTLSDLAADVRAPTPTAAAEAVILEKEQWIKKIQDLRSRLSQLFQLFIQRHRNHLQKLETRLVDPRHRLHLIRLKLDDFLGRISTVINREIHLKQLRISENQRYLRRVSPQTYLSEYRSTLSRMAGDLSLAVTRSISEKRRVLHQTALLLDSYNPTNVLKRGYSITFRKSRGSILKEASSVAVGEDIQVVLFKGKIECEVTSRET